MFTLILSLIRHQRQQHQVRQSLGRVLARPDDHLLDDMGITREDATRLLDRPALTDPFHAQVRFTPAAATGAGSFRWAISGSSRPM